MSIQMVFFGSVATSTITASSAVVEAFRLGSPATAGIFFKTNGVETTIRNTSVSNVANWVTPTTAASEWEIRATLVSGAVPTTGTLGVWQALTIERSWTLTVEVDAGPSTSELTFEFRKVGGSAAEFTITGTSLSAEAFGMF